jgi:AcrR family transcriptional regulator
MRITARAKQEVRQRILASGEKLFLEKGFGETTTRDLSRAAGIAVGTLFNYFPGREALGMAILASDLKRGRESFLGEDRRFPTLEEGLFSHIAAELRAMRPHRSFAGPVLEAAMSPFGASPVGTHADATRRAHLDIVAEMIVGHRGPDAATSATLHLYWSLYLGVLAFWSADDSPNQEDTLAMLDQATRLFAASLGAATRDRSEGERP